MRSKLLVLGLLVASLFAVVPGCRTGVPAYPYLYSPAGLFAGTNADVTVFYAKVEGEAGVQLFPLTDPPVHVLGPVSAATGRVIVVSKSRNFNATFAIGDPLPAWVQAYIPPKVIRELGITFSPAEGGATGPTARGSPPRGSRSLT